MALDPLSAAFEIGDTLIKRIWPDPAQAAQAQLELLKLKQSGELAQIAVNNEEAKSTNWFVAGWRPFTGWACASGLAYVSILEPMVRFLALVVFHYQGTFPAIDTSITMQVLLGMLGLGAMRSFEKTQGVEGKR